MGMDVLLVEDNSLVRVALQAGLEGYGLTVHTAQDARSAMDSFATHNPQVAVLDLHLGTGPTGIDLGMVMRERSPGIGLVLLTSFTDPRLLRASLDSVPGGMLYLVKQSIDNLDLLISAINASPMTGTDRTERAPRSTLTATQSDTLRLVAAGLSNSEIARVRVVTVAAVEKTIARTAQALDIPYSDEVNQRVALAKKYFQLIGRTT
jgi:DNA-binding NarL/FixJ family response regulator